MNGTGVLLRLALRLDRVRLPVWVLVPRAGLAAPTMPLGVEPLPLYVSVLVDWLCINGVLGMTVDGALYVSLVSADWSKSKSAATVAFTFPVPTLWANIDSMALATWWS